MNKKLTLICIFSFSLTFCFAQNFQWAKGMGGKGDEIGKSIIIDINGNSISTGFYYDTTDFDPGLGVFNQISKGGPDIFITKLNSQGNLIWAKSFGGSQNDY